GSGGGGGEGRTAIGRGPGAAGRGREVVRHGGQLEPGRSTRQLESGEAQSSVILADRARFRHTTISSAISAPNAAGAPRTGSTPSRASRVASSPCPTARRIAAPSRSLTGGGAPA